MTYQPQPQKTEGGQREVITSDDNVQQLLMQILKELKKMNLHLQLLTDNEITDQEIQ